jgi:hypothetical protein
MGWTEDQIGAATVAWSKRVKGQRGVIVHGAQDRAGICLQAEVMALREFVQQRFDKTNCICRLNEIMAPLGTTSVECTNCKARALLNQISK